MGALSDEPGLPETAGANRTEAIPGIAGPNRTKAVPETARESAEVEDFLASFDTFVQAVRRARGASQPDRSDVLTLSQYAILQALSHRARARVRDLATEAGITPSTATRILDVLERRAIVRRARSPEDRRGVTVTLTDFGREALRTQDAWLRGRQRAFFASLPSHEQELAPDLLIRLAALIDELAAGCERA